MKLKPKRFAVIGLGNFGYHIARSLYEGGDQVLAIDVDRAKVQAIDAHCTEAVVLDATDSKALDALGILELDAVVVAIGSRISSSILVCLHLHELGVKKIVAKAMDDDHEKILRKVGATEIIHPERDMARRVSRGLSKPNVLDFIPLGDEFDIVQVSPPREFIGKTLKDLDLRARYAVHVIAVRDRISGNNIVIPTAEKVITDSDTLMILGRSSDLRKSGVIK